MVPTFCAQLRSHIVGVIYVDDTDLMHFCIDEPEDALDTFFYEILSYAMA